jgi:ABC-type glycerol-3-phosphate transport system permease component
MYFGSVKFFKHLIVTVFIALLVLPTVFAIVASVKSAENTRRIETMEATINTFGETLPDKLTAAVRKIVDDTLKVEKSALKSELNSQVEGLNQQIEEKINGLYESTVEQLDELYWNLNYYIDLQTASISEQTSASMNTKLQEFKEALQASISLQIDELRQQLNMNSNGQTADGD